MFLLSDFYVIVLFIMIHVFVVLWLKVTLAYWLNGDAACWMCYLRFSDILVGTFWLCTLIDFCDRIIVSKVEIQSTRHWQISEKWHSQHMLYMQIRNHKTLTLTLVLKSTCESCVMWWVDFLTSLLMLLQLVILVVFIIMYIWCVVAV